MKKFGFNQFQIKIFMALLMVTDHLSLVPGLISGDLIGIFHILTRCVAVWFAYGAVEGVLYTHDIKKYIYRLYGAAAIMFSGNILLGFLFASKKILISNNIFLTLAIGVTIVAALKYIDTKSTRYIVVAVNFVVGFVIGEGGYLLLPFMIITYYTYKNAKLRNILYMILAAVICAIFFVPYDTVAATVKMLAYNSDFMFITVIPFLYLYNGEHGPYNKFSKYFFYVFYPAHLWILTIIAYFVS